MHFPYLGITGTTHWESPAIPPPIWKKQPLELFLDTNQLKIMYSIPDFIVETLILL
jgi:hypothetical protein